MKNLLFILGCAVVVIGCNKKIFFDGPNFFQDDFEAYSSLEDLLLPANDELWSLTQQTLPENTIIIDSTNVHSGNQSLKFMGKKTSDGMLSKCSIAKQNMAFWEDETLSVKAWYFIQGEATLNWLFLMDLEEQTAVGAGPGMRVALVNNQLLIEHKYYESNILQPSGQEIDFPRNQWVELIWEVKLSQKHKGSIKLWQDGQLIIDSEDNRTLPKDFLYSVQGTKGMYSSVELGITANPSGDDLTLWVDDILFEKVN